MEDRRSPANSLRSSHLVDPELRPLLELLPTITVTKELLPVIRAPQPPFPADPQAVQAVDLDIRSIQGPVGAPPVSVSVYTPKANDRRLPCILHIHGGGFVAGSSAQLSAVHRSLAFEANCVIVSVDYRLAPETPFPGAIEDCYAALAWVVKHATELGVDPGGIGVMGESAGGGLAACLALLARDRAEHALAFQHLIYPMLDDRTCTASDMNPFTGEYIWTRESNAFGWASLLGVPPGSAGVSPYAAAARAESLAGLPRAFIATGALDLFAEENMDYARRLMRQGVEVEFHIYPGAYHAFNIAPEAKVAHASRRDSLLALKRVLHPAS